MLSVYSVSGDTIYTNSVQQAPTAQQVENITNWHNHFNWISFWNCFAHVQRKHSPLAILSQRGMTIHPSFQIQITLRFLAMFSVNMFFYVPFLYFSKLSAMCHLFQRLWAQPGHCFMGVPSLNRTNIGSWNNYQNLTICRCRSVLTMSNPRAFVHSCIIVVYFRHAHKNTFTLQDALHR